MLKKILEKRVEQFKTDFPEFQVSKKTGSLYARIGVHEVKKDVKHTGRAITKGTVSKLGTKIQWVENKSRYVYLLTPKGRLMVSRGGGNFGGVTLKNISREFTGLRSIFFIGKKFEWLKEYPALWDYKFFQGFNSLSEAKKFLGFSFISDVDFAGLFLLEHHFDFLTPMILAKDKKNVVKLYKNLDTELMDSIRDYIEMCQDNGFEVEIPAGKNRLEELHQEVTWKINEKNAENYSKEYRYDIEEKFTDIWRERGLVFRRLETPYEMYLQGLKQQHCIGTNFATTLHNYAFYSFTYEDKDYDIQIYKNGSVGQFYARKNKPVPQELKDKVKNNIKLEFNLIDTKPDLENYPLIKELEIPYIF